ncbi:hypothetical protein EJ05DRAFT_126010 [Pseudovirgaria hyperparasitica]|uniref:Uncharacterized protein n=1 Tax=Pseudovirgaria hyperparasitica TaxID=470096 RepID=A0A6A6VWY8_9PEZI|nr:uncharacterized protein EJ05DRAFT_126010 [Pseudovirgaria hyperparasitica]KAF2755198.1 hypothetical protein EJ05DRAFT_126010 [Pseudovirgaria hyperparasitica]
MCNGIGRPSQGGTIATLRTPTSSSSSTSYDILFTNTTDLSAPPQTCATFRTPSTESLHDCWLVIHHDGDLSVPHHARHTQPLYTFPVRLDRRNSMALPEALQLGVGGKGVVGRRMALVEGNGAMGWRGKVLAEGVIGWN